MFLLMVLSLMLVLGMVLYSPPSLAEVACLRWRLFFIAVLSVIILALQIIFTLPVSSFIIFIESRSVLSALDSFNISLNPLVLSTLEWLYLVHRRRYRVRFCWVPGYSFNVTFHTARASRAGETQRGCPLALPRARLSKLVVWGTVFNACLYTPRADQRPAQYSRGKLFNILLDFNRLLQLVKQFVKACD